MRNLKKFLALVLAMVMAFSLMLTANAANTAKDFDDAANITEAFVEATDVLTGMKVFQGDAEAATFRPADTINRAEVAALIYRLATGDVDDTRAGTYANYGNFADVSESDWFAGYVGYCANAGYIKGHNGYFNPYDSVTGYETLAMILRAIGYDKNHEFEGTTWETNVSALATQLGILTNIKTTHYGNTLYLASRRDVVAELLFQADAKVPMVVYTPAFGYQQTGMSGGVVGTSTNPTLGKHIFGLTLDEDGILLGNQQTGEDGSVMGYAGTTRYMTAKATATADALYETLDFSAYTWAGTVVTPETYDTSKPAKDAAAPDVKIGLNVEYELETGIDLIGHKLKLWFDDGSGVVSNNKKHVFAYFDKATKTDVVTIVPGVNAGTTTYPTNPTCVDTTANNAADGGKNLFDLAKESGFKGINANTVVEFNNSFGKFGSAFGAAADTGNGVAVDEANPIASPVHMYKLISNNSDEKLDAVISLNIESSQITESNSVNRVPTLGMPTQDLGTVGTGASTAAQLETMFITTGTGGANPTAGKNTKLVPATTGTLTGVIAQAALVGDSAKALGDYHMGIHITGTSPRTVSAAEAQAINTTGEERAYFLLNKVTATVEGTVVAYNVDKGTVTLDNGTVLERSKFYDTVVITNPKEATANTSKVTNSQAPVSAIPQGWLWNNANEDLALIGKWREGYANTTYKFYTDYEGKYLGAERTFGETFLYGTYLDYDQKTSTSTFNYYMTGVDLNGEIKTVPVAKYWFPSKADGTTAEPNFSGTAPAKVTETTINGTNVLGIPFRDATAGGTGATNGIAKGAYTGFAIQGTTADSVVADLNINRNEYLNNMARLGVKSAAVTANGTTDNPAFDVTHIDIAKDDITVGAKVTKANGDRYFTEATKFILVSGFGTDSVKAEVYNGISELKGSAAHVMIDMNNTISLASGWTATAAKQFTYYTESPYTYAQSGATSMKIDTIILPKEAVTWTGGSGLYYVGDTTPTSINSWGTDAWKYNLYLDGELQQLWLTNDPSVAAANSDANLTGVNAGSDIQLVPDTFVQLRDTGKKANDGEPIYTAGAYDPATGAWSGGGEVADGVFGAAGKEGTYLTNGKVATLLPAANGVEYLTEAVYSAVTRDAQTATFTGTDTSKLLRVADAKVVNLNAANSPKIGTSNGYVWPGITDLATLNEAGSISPVTARALKVAAVVDANNPLVVTCIYVCWDQNP